MVVVVVVVGDGKGSVLSVWELGEGVEWPGILIESRVYYERVL